MNVGCYGQIRNGEQEVVFWEGEEEKEGDGVGVETRHIAIPLEQVRVLVDLMSVSSATGAGKAQRGHMVVLPPGVEHG